MALGLSLREWREQENVPPLKSVIDSKGNYHHLHNEKIGPNEDRKSAVDLAFIREDVQRPPMFLRWVDGKAQVANALTKLQGCQTSREEGTRKSAESQVTIKVAGACDRNVDTCDITTNRDLT